MGQGKINFFAAPVAMRTSVVLSYVAGVEQCVRKYTARFDGGQNMLQKYQQH